MRPVNRSVPAVVVAILAFALTPAFGVTHKCPALTQNETWTTAGSPYVLDCLVAVPQGVTLTIQAGTIVKGSVVLGGGLDIQGTLLADGTGNPIYFTSLRDDIGGDTDGDPTLPAPGDWAGIRFAES